MSESSYTLGYWNIRGLGEVVRLLLEYLEQKYEQKSYELTDGPEFSRQQWLDEKFNIGLDFPNLPYLKDGDFKLTETTAILSYLAEKHDQSLVGETPQEKATISMISGPVTSAFWAYCMKCYGEDLETVQTIATEKFEPIVKYLGDKKYLTGDKLSWVDFYFFYSVEALVNLGANIFESYPTLQKYYENFLEIPQIKAYKAKQTTKLLINNKQATVNGEF